MLTAFLCGDLRAEPTQSASAQLQAGDAPAIGLGYSSRWNLETEDSQIYISYNTATMSSSVLTLNTVSVDYGGARFAYPSFDFFGRILNFGQSEKQPNGRISLWGRYGFGAMVRQGTLSDTRGGIDQTTQNASLLLFSARLGAHAAFDYLTWIRPYAGIEIVPSYFRQSGAIPAGDMKGFNFLLAPVVGARVPLPFLDQASLLVEGRHNSALNSGSANQIFASSWEWMAGLGVTF